MSIKKEDKKQFSRRKFIKATGVTAGALGIASIGSATPALAGEKSKSAIINFAVTEVDRPPYMEHPFEGADKLERFDELKIVAFNPDFYEMVGEEFKNHWVTGSERVKDNIPGYTLIEHSLHNAAWKSHKTPSLIAWESNTTLPPGVSKWEASPEDNNMHIKRAGHALGAAGPIGITDLNEKWFYSNTHSGTLTFSDKVEKPIQMENEWIIPKTVNKVVVMLMPYDLEMQKYTPSKIASAATGMGYSKSAETASKMAEFIRGLGYTALPTNHTVSLLVPQAIDAGLGELGRHGLLINPELGSNLRIAIVLTDMPIASDKPIKFGAAEFCKTCMKCADMCPSQSISKEKEPSYEIQCSANNPGMKKWYINPFGCYKFWADNGTDCGNCITVCPYSKPNTWIHDVVKGTSSKTSLFNSTFKVLDDVLGYGSTLEDNKPNEWWENK